MWAAWIRSAGMTNLPIAGFETGSGLTGALASLALGVSGIRRAGTVVFLGPTLAVPRKALLFRSSLTNPGSGRPILAVGTTACLGLACTWPGAECIGGLNLSVQSVSPYTALL